MAKPYLVAMRRVTNREVLALESNPDSPKALTFLLNWCQHQYGNATARAAARLHLSGFEVAVAQFGNGFTIDGHFATGEQMRDRAGETRRDGAIGGE